MSQTPSRASVAVCKYHVLSQRTSFGKLMRLTLLLSKVGAVESVSTCNMRHDWSDSVSNPIENSATTAVIQDRDTTALGPTRSARIGGKRTCGVQ
jgi:hypothetical protein